MTSPLFNSRKAAAESDLRIFNSLPEAIRHAMNNCEGSPPSAQVVRDTLLRGVPIEKIVETISKKRSPKP